MTTSNHNNEQDRFDRSYITVGEICKRFNVNRSSIRHARESGKLPYAVLVGNQYIWPREAVEPHLVIWGEELESRRNA